MLVGEEWRDVPGWEGLYQVSSEKRVRSLPRETAKGTLGGRILMRRPRVALSFDNQAKHCYVEVLHGLAFPEGITGS